MKTILSTIALLLALNASAQVVSYKPTSFTDTFVRTIVNAAQARAYFGISYDSTNSPTLNGVNLFTGTNTFPAASFYKANGLAFRVLYSNPTNINVSSVAVIALNGDGVTNNGDFALCTQVLKIELPPLLGTNSSLYFTSLSEVRESNTSGAGLAFYVGANTNFVGYQNNGLGGLARGSVGGTPQMLMSNAGSFTNQVVGGQIGGSQRVFGLNNFCGTDTNFTVYIGAYTTTSCTNINFRKLVFYELVND